MRRRPLILLAAGLVAGFALGELGVRLFGPPEPEGPPLSSFLQPSADPLLDFEVRRNAEKPFGRGLVRTNAEGRRVLDPSAAQPEGPPDALRVAILGDSTCFGWRLPYERTYVPRLQQLVREELGLELQLRNHCVPGYDAAQCLRVLETQVLPWEPDLLLWHYDHNDAHPGTNRRGVASASRLVSLIQRRLQGRDERGLTPEDEILPVDGAFQLASGPSWERHREALERMAQLVRERELAHLFIVFDSVLDRAGHDGLHYTRLHVPLLELLAEQGLTVFDSFDPYQAKMAAEGWDDLSPQYLSHDPLDAHPDQFGHAWVARQVLDALLAEGLLAPRGG